jgi:hypothetical protein
MVQCEVFVLDESVSKMCEVGEASKYLWPIDGKSKIIPP